MKPVTVFSNAHHITTEHNQPIQLMWQRVAKILLHSISKTPALAIIVLFSSALLSTASPQIVPEYFVHNDTTTNQYAPDIAIDDDGNLNIAYATDDSLYLAMFDTSGSLIRRTAFAGYYSYSHQINIATHGDYRAVVWEYMSIDPAGESNTRCRLLTNLGVPVNNEDGNPLIMEYFNSWADHHPDVAFITDTTFFLVWNHTINDLYGRLVSTALHFKGTPFKITMDNIENLDRWSPRVAASPSTGTAVVVWADDRTGFRQVYGQRIDATGTLSSTSFLVSETLANSAASPVSLSVAMHDDGSFAVVWASAEDTLVSAWVRCYSPNGVPVGGITKINDSVSLAYNDISTDIDYDTDGQFVVVWEELIGDYVRIAGQRFTSAGELVGNNFGMPGSHDSHEYFPRVAYHNGKLYLAKFLHGRHLATLSVWESGLPLGLPAEPNPVPIEFSLLPAYPNPFNASTTIPFDLHKKSDLVILTVYDLLGNTLLEVSRKNLLPGRHSFQWSGVNRQGQTISSGVYLFRLAVDGESQTRKMSLLK